MKKQFVLSSALAMACTVPAFAAYDGTVKVTAAPAQYAGGGSGGAFLVDTQGSKTMANNTVVNYSFSYPGVKKGTLPGIASDSFLTFCIERDENFNPSDAASNDNVYDVKVSQAADRGGVNTNSGDPISKATAWLFSEFTKGTLNTSVPAFAYNSTGAGNLQNAIWWLEEELSGSTPGAAYKFLVDAAITKLGLANYSAARTTDANGYAGVKVMNMYNGDPRNNVIAGVAYNQDFLVVVPEPSTYIAGGLALLPLLFGLRTRIGKK